MKAYLLVLIFSLCSLLVNGQNTIQGCVLSSDSSVVVNAKIDLIQSSDNVMVNSTLSDLSGNYIFKNVPKGTYLIQASYFESTPTQKKAMLWGNTILTVNFTIGDNILLEEVNITASGIDIKGDTTSYVVSQFTSGKERNLRELLDRLPNITVDESSKSITANGKHISRVLMDNQDLFQGNTSVPLENLSSSGINKIDVIENYSEYSIYEGFKTTNETVINIGVDGSMRNKLKGDLEVSGGVLNKYNIRNSSLYIGKKSMFSGILTSNNIGSQLLNFQDVMAFSGGLKNVLISGDNPMDNIMSMMDTYSSFINNRKDIKQRENSLVSLNYIANPSDKLKVSVNGIYNYDHSLVKNEQSYDFLSGLQYNDSSRIKDSQHNALLNMKITYMPTNDVNVIYSGNTMLSFKNSKTDNTVIDNRISYRSKPQILNTYNELLFIRRFGSNTLNLLLNYTRRDIDETSDFKSANPYYPITLNIPNQYRYDVDYKVDEYAAQLFYLHRLNDSYYLRLSTKGKYDKHYFSSGLDGDTKKDWYYNDATLDYARYHADVLVGKDKGRLNFDVGLHYTLLHANTNIDRDFANRTLHVLSPSLRMRYELTPSHHITVNYEYGATGNALTSLVGAKYLKSFNQVISSNLDQFYSNYHRVSLTQLLMLPYLGLSVMNLLSYEHTKDAVTNNNNQDGYISLIEKRAGSRKNLFSWLSTIEYRFIPIPLNIQANINYTHTYSPVYNFDELYKAKLNGIRFMAQATTFYKRGFNGKVQWLFDRQNYKGVPIQNKITNNNLLGMLSWQNAKFYASVNARYNKYKLNTNTVDNIFYGFEARYNLTKTIELRLSGIDVMHLSERKQTTGIIDSYYSVSSRVWYMPGSILIGALLKY